MQKKIKMNKQKIKKRKQKYTITIKPKQKILKNFE